MMRNVPAVIQEVPANRRFMETAGIEPAQRSLRHIGLIPGSNPGGGIRERAGLRGVWERCGVRPGSNLQGVAS